MEINATVYQTGISLIFFLAPTANKNSVYMYTLFWWKSQKICNFTQ